MQAEVRADVAADGHPAAQQQRGRVQRARRCNDILAAQQQPERALLMSRISVRGGRAWTGAGDGNAADLLRAAGGARAGGQQDALCKGACVQDTQTLGSIQMPSQALATHMQG